MMGEVDYLERKGVIGRLKTLSKPTGKPLWGAAVRTMLIIILAGILASYLGFGEGVGAVVSITLFACIIIDQPLPFRKVLPLAAVGAFLMSMAFASASIALLSLPVFIVLTAIWAFFPLSLYIFGDAEGLFGFMIFSSYFIATTLVKSSLTTLGWVECVLFAYLIASILLVLKFFGRDSYTRKMVAVGFLPQTHTNKMVSIRKNMAGLSIKKSFNDLLKDGVYLTGLRGYGKMVQSRLSGKTAEVFRGFMEESDAVSAQIADHIVNKRGGVDLQNLKSKFKELNFYKGDVDGLDAAKKVSKTFMSLIEGANAMISVVPTNEEHVKITSTHVPVTETLRSKFNLDSLYIRHALRFTIAMTIALLFIYLDHTRDALWIAMGVLIIIKPDVTSTIDNMILRVSFNLFAIILAIILAFFFPHDVLLIFALLALFFFRAFFPTYMGLSVMALTLFVVFIWPTGTVFENAVARLVDISIGALSSLFVVYAILPKRLTMNLPEQLSRVIKANQEYMEVVLVSGEEYDHKKATSKLEKAFLEHSNLEVALKKVQDSFKDVSEDLTVYEEISAASYSLTADTSAVAGLIEYGAWERDLTPLNDLGSKLLEIISSAVEEDKKPQDWPDLSIYSKILDEALAGHRELEQYMSWMASDIQIMHDEVKKAAEMGALGRYRDLT
ncbi:hypothetical protein MSWAN_0011 [Methanobacterium paludis]|uniref:Integral membrane bound transporter domain-containing protein n=1 Tax=Methanobacterium paludis (strain DSM 25820 / JCM 18151 / SWAN1) TaxID=868131 RepID=F6D7B7_METPW|nr:hypothetical protein MSWAN_0011 [Methanobacterium paludis]